MEKEEKVKLAIKLSRYKKAKEEFLAENIGDMYCRGCNSWVKPLSISHTISRARCEEIGKPELYYSKGNFELMCYYDSGACHETWESGTLGEKQHLINWDKMMAYVKKHDPIKYQQILVL